MKQKRKILLITIFFLIQSTGTTASLDEMYNAAMTGEKKSENYDGPFFPQSQFNEFSGLLIKSDESWKENYFRELIFPTIYRELKDFDEDGLLVYKCPDSLLKKEYKYIRYLYRLVFFSYLYELHTSYEKFLRKENSQGNCRIPSWKNFISSCIPQSKNMKTYRLRVTQAWQQIKFGPSMDDSSLMLVFKKYSSKKIPGTAFWKI